MKLLILAAFAAALQPATYVVHAQLPRGENLAATVRVTNADSLTITPDGGTSVHVALRPRGARPDRSIAPILEIVSTANNVAQASLHGESKTQIILGPQRTCVDLTLVTQGNTVTATGTASLPPPPDDRGHNGDADVNVRITATLDHQQLASARGEIGPVGNNRGPHFTWSLTKSGE